MFLDRRLTRRAADGEGKALSKADAHAKGFAAEHCWLLEFAFRNEELAAPSPVAEIVDALVGAGLPETARQDVHTILNELYVNALDYGVLDLDSRQKADADGFNEFYRLRADKLEQLAGREPAARDWIKVDCVLNISDRPVLELTVADSGAGVISNRDNDTAADEESMNKRGLKLVRALASDVQFNGKRNQIKVANRC